jgi:hypothetical protein
MELAAFLKIFQKYDLSFIKEYQEVNTAIIDILTGWKNEKIESELKKVSAFNSNYIFCEIGKSVKVYRWTYINTLEKGVYGRIIYESKIAFRFVTKRED